MKSTRNVVIDRLCDVGAKRLAEMDAAGILRFLAGHFDILQNGNWLAKMIDAPELSGIWIWKIKTAQGMEQNE